MSVGLRVLVPDQQRHPFAADDLSLLVRERLVRPHAIIHFEVLVENVDSELAGLRRIDALATPIEPPFVDVAVAIQPKGPIKVALVASRSQLPGQDPLINHIHYEASVENDLVEVLLEVIEAVLDRLKSEQERRIPRVRTPDQRLESLVWVALRALELENSRLRQDLANARIEAETLRRQLEVAMEWVREAQVSEKPSLVRSAAGGLAAVLLAIIGGAAGGAAQEVVADRLSDDPGIHELAQEACAIAGEDVIVIQNR